MKTIAGVELLQAWGADYFRALSTFGALQDSTILSLLETGQVMELSQGEVLYRPGDKADGFYVILQGTIALYMHHHDRDALTRLYRQGEQLGFVDMIGLHDHWSTSVAQQATILVHISSDQFFELHLQAPDDFGLLMINLSREMARTVITLAEVIVDQSVLIASGRQGR
ncbi:Crp/Fnr family transcriptional regulator [Marinobacterium rhizophilum]|uniref:Cyclic nucleotide-binding domain-containing protein n=1 Tax=Marinobacterium rhizophilum TaxID=420402 RepID=A0ABY5HCR5_9GAMM|nr:cyclic nucleotide-binding domain-containing protein [Marinobacterium rhizophilum]UTW10138.1 cyclic nucleotide-binding domain-containing protein [Marinobacterium rhizophilum]